MIAAVRERLAGYKVPRRVVVVEDLPRTASGKVRKHLLRDVVTPGRPGAPDDSPAKEP